MYNNPIDTLKPEEIIMYLRKSRADDPSLTVEEVLEKHETRLDEWADRTLHAPIPPQNRFKEIISGGESVADRPEFRKVLKLIESPNIKAVLVVEIARLGRPDTAEIGLISKIFRFTNTLVITPERTFNVTDEFEREMFESELKRGAFYLEYTKKILSRGLEMSVKDGNYLAPAPPYGYDKVTVMDGKKKCPTLAINKEEAEIVRKIFNEYVHENIGTQVIANRLNDLGLKSPKGLPWKPSAIRVILENIHYIGKVRRNRRKVSYVVNNGEFRKTRQKAPEDVVIICEGRHEAIISDELFYAAQEKRGRVHRTADNKELRNPLASLLFCECGHAMAFRQSTRGELKHRPPRLACNSQHYCGNGSCLVDEMVDYVAEVLRQRIADFEKLVENGGDDSTDFHEKHLRSLEKKLADLNSKEVNLWETQLDTENRMPPAVFQTITDKLVKERAELEIAIEKTRAVISTPKTNETHLVTLQTALSALLDPDKSVAEKNHFLKQCIDRIDYKREPSVRPLGKGVGRQWLPAPIEATVKLKV